MKHLSYSTLQYSHKLLVVIQYKKVGVKQLATPCFLSLDSCNSKRRLGINVRSTKLYKSNDIYYLLIMTIDDAESGILSLNHHLKLVSINQPFIIQHSTRSTIIKSNTASSSFQMNLWIQLDRLVDQPVYLFAHNENDDDDDKDKGSILLQRVFFSDIIQPTMSLTPFYHSKALSLVHPLENHYFLDIIQEIGFKINQELRIYQHCSFSTRITTTFFFKQQLIYCFEYTCTKELELVIFLIHSQCEKSGLGRIQEEWKEKALISNPQKIECTHECPWMTCDDIQIIESIERHIIKTEKFGQELELKIAVVETNRRILEQMLLDQVKMKA